VDTVFGGCYRKSVFDKIGLFNEQLTRGQDVELNIRLRKSGGRILLLPDIVSYYYARTEWKSFLSYNWNNGLWAILPFRYSKNIPVSWRHLTPLVFVTTLIVHGRAVALFLDCRLAGRSRFRVVFIGEFGRLRAHRLEGKKLAI
jgi:GT2 family glycosyltransferase